MLSSRVLLPLIGCAGLMFAQFPGGYPGGYPGGGYPGGARYPGGRTGSPGGMGLPRFPGKKKKDKPSKEQLENLTDLRGTLRRLDAKMLYLEADDKRILQIVRNDETKLLKNNEEAKSSEFVPGDHLIVEAATDDENRFIAVRINWEKEGTEQERVAARRPLPETVRFEDDGPKPAAGGDARDGDGPPRLSRGGASAKKAEEEAKAAPAPAPAAAPGKQPEPEEVREKGTLVVDKAVDLEPVPKVKRGRPAQTPRSVDLDDSPAPAVSAGGRPAETREMASAAPRAAASAAPVIPDTAEDPLLARARESVNDFTEVLPNYMAKQVTTRFVGNGKADRWQPQDNFTADLVYQDGKESYTNVMLNGKAAKGKIEQTGAWSRGEFGTTLRDIFSPATNATFRPRGNATIANRKAKYYDFSVEQENSHWQIGVPGQTYFPSYRGSLWIDVETARVLRVEMQGRRIPETFPVDTVETAIDFDFVKIGGGSYLVPVHSEALSCLRTSNTCSKNVIDFRNYRKFGAQSELILSQ
jgi:hypothetical protein